MLRYRLVSTLQILLLVLFLFGCIDENQDLVNPPPQTETVTIRFVNFASDGKERVLSLDGISKTSSVAYAACSETIKPPYDSAIASTYLNGSFEYKNDRKLRFIRNTSYTVFALPSPPGDSIMRPVDTLMAVGTIVGLNETTNKASLTIFNAIPDSSGRRYSLSQGCPNGPSLVQNLSFRLSSPPIEIRSGSTVVSLVRYKSNEVDIIGLFEFNIAKAGQYVLVIYEPTPGKEGLMLIDQFNPSTSALSLVNPVSVQGTDIRAVNFSSNNIAIQKMPDETIASDLAPNRIADYVNVSACNSQNKDSLAIFTGSDTSFVETSLEILKKYSIFIFDSAGASRKMPVLAEPIYLSQAPIGRAIIRVINAAYNQPGLTLSIGARDDDSSSSGFRAGEVIATNVKYGNISEAALIPAGLAPITLFTATEPAYLLYCSLIQLTPENSYTFVILNDESGKFPVKIAIIEDTEVNSDIRYLDAGVFVQVIHDVPGDTTVTVSMPPVLSGGKLYYSGSLATVLPTGSHTINVKGVNTTIDASPEKRNLIIAAGTMQSPELLAFTYVPDETSSEYYKRRFINASKEIERLSVRLNCDTCAVIAENIKYGEASVFQTVNMDRKISLHFAESKDDRTIIYRINDINLPFGKNYTIIFGGSKEYGYSTVVHQEY